MASGHGVSEAVRQHIPIWVTDEVAKAAGLSRAHLGRSSAWKRVARRNSPSGKGFEREFSCSYAQDVKLLVHSPASDMSADAYTFFHKGKAIAGGKTSLKSVNVSNKVSTTDKTELQSSPGKAQYTPMTEDELAKMSYGTGSYVFLEMERG